MVFRNSKYITGENYLMIRNPRAHFILDPKYLDEDFIPEKILFRHKQMEELDYIRRSIMDENRNASDTILLGGSGTGKTALLRDLLAKSRQFLTRAPNLKIKVAYINCDLISNERTFWIKLATELKTYYTSTTSLDQVRTSVLEELSENLLLIMIDEIDLISLEYPEILDSITNTLARSKGITIIAAANRKDWSKNLGPKNTFKPKTITCPEYDVEQLRQLCQDRLFKAIVNVNETVEEGVINILANRAHRLGGDARKLIKMLHIAVEESDRKNQTRITKSDAEYACAQIEDKEHLLIDALKNKSHDIHAVLLAVLNLNEENLLKDKENEDFGVKSGDILDEYKRLIEQNSKEEPLKYRSIMDIIQNLLLEGFIDRTRARARGNVWYYELNSEFISKDEILKSLGAICDQCKSLTNNN